MTLIGALKTNSLLHQLYKIRWDEMDLKVHLKLIEFARLGHIKNGKHPFVWEQVGWQGWTNVGFLEASYGAGFWHNMLWNLSN